jgi:hypothetical protein
MLVCVCVGAGGYRLCGGVRADESKFARGASVFDLRFLVHETSSTCSRS